MARIRVLFLSSPLSVAVVVAVALQRPRTPGCPSYIASDSQLVAHAGGGLPERTYANNAAAMDLAAQHGFRLIELDFIERGARLTIGHEGLPESDLPVDALMTWLDINPGISIVTDFKSDNIVGLARLKSVAGPRLGRFIAQIYDPTQYGSVVALGYLAPILTVYRLSGDGWIDDANALPLRAVTMPVARRDLAHRVQHPVFLNTVNEPMNGFGLYTDRLVPERKGGR